MANAGQAVLLVGFVFTTVIGHAQQADNKALAPLAFLTGRWVVQEGNEVQEETWSPAFGDSMTGSFRIVQGGKPVFYEFWAVEVDQNQPVMKLKHFNANLAGWEEKNTSVKMPLLSKAEGDAVFAEENGSVSLHYHLAGETLTCTVHHVKGGQNSDETFSLKRASR